MEAVALVIGDDFKEIDNPVTTPLHRQSVQSSIKTCMSNIRLSEHDIATASTPTPPPKRQRRDEEYDQSIVSLQRQVLQQQLNMQQMMIENARCLAPILVKAEQFFNNASQHPIVFANIVDSANTPHHPNSDCCLLNVS
jgi:hypothetical protein